MPVRELLARVNSRELAEWRAYELIEPFGEQRADLRAAIVASVMANAFRGKDQRAYEPKDFMPKFDEPQQPMDWRKMRSMMGALVKTE